MKETLPKSVQELILSLREKLKDEPEIVDMFERCYSNTLDTTVKKMVKYIMNRVTKASKK